MSTKSNIVIVAHDAGGAELLSAYVRAKRHKFIFHCLVAGPAITIFRRKKIKAVSISSSQAVEQVIKKLQSLELVLVGTSWGSMLERNTIQMAKSQGIKTVAFIDHWVNYRERFGYPDRDWKHNVPTEIWVGDRAAYQLAHRQFASQTVRLVTNYYFREIKQAYAAKKKYWPKDSGGILFVSEPLGAVTKAKRAGKVTEQESTILATFLTYLVKIGWHHEVIIRYHPSESANKYGTLLRKFQSQLRITRSYQKNALSDLARVSTVVGMKSMFLVVAQLCHKKTISYLPLPALSCPLSLSGIIKAKNNQQLAVALRRKTV